MIVWPSGPNRALVIHCASQVRVSKVISDSRRRLTVCVQRNTPAAAPAIANAAIAAAFTHERRAGGAVATGDSTD